MNNSLTEYVKTEGLWSLSGGVPSSALLVGCVVVAGFLGYLVGCYVVEHGRRRRVKRRRRKCLESNLAIVNSGASSRPLAARIPVPIDSAPEEAVEAVEADSAEPVDEAHGDGRSRSRRCGGRGRIRATRKPKQESVY